MAATPSSLAAAAAAVLVLFLSSTELQLAGSSAVLAYDHPSNVSSFFPSPSAPPPGLDSDGFLPVPTSGEFIGKKSSSGSSKTLLVEVDRSPVIVLVPCRYV
ncbi:hypothetical protein LINGRAHAP2_LOCUS9453 [Linum grandiflorum]